MAKKAWMERNKKKQETVKKFAAIRAELKAKTRLRRPGETAAQRQPDARREPLLDDRPPPRLSAQVRLFASDVPRSGVEWFDSRRTKAVGKLYFNMSDPISDMLTRIRNASRGAAAGGGIAALADEGKPCEHFEKQGYVTEVSVTIRN